MCCRRWITQFSIIFSLSGTISEKGIMKHYFLQSLYQLLMICHLKMGFITFLFTFHGPTVILSFGRIWSSLMYFLLAISFIALTLPYPPCYQGPFLFFSKLSYEEFLTNFSHFLFYNLCRSDFIYILSLYFGMIFPKENN